MAMPPVFGFYVVFVKGNPAFCLSCDSTGNVILNPYHPKDGSLVWCVLPIHGSNGFFLQHIKTARCATFKDEGAITVAKLQQGDQDFVLLADDVGDGFCAINNVYEDSVFFVEGGDYRAKQPVIPWGWNGADSQRWQFVPNGALNRGAP